MISPRKTLLNISSVIIFNNMSKILTEISVGELLDKISDIDRSAAQQAEQNWVRFRPRIIFNKRNLFLMS